MRLGGVRNLKDGETFSIRNVRSRAFDRDAVCGAQGFNARQEAGLQRILDIDEQEPFRFIGQVRDAVIHDNITSIPWRVERRHDARVREVRNVDDLETRRSRREKGKVPFDIERVSVARYPHERDRSRRPALS